MRQILILGCCGLLLAGCASSDVPAPIYDRSPKASAPIEDRSPKAAAAAPAKPPAAPAKPPAAPAKPPAASTPGSVAPVKDPAPSSAPPAVPQAKPTAPPAAAAKSKTAPATPASAPPAPVTDASAQSTAPAAASGAAATSAVKGSSRSAAEIRPYREGDWRPEYYTVKRGDTLYSIALDYGQDYRDLAAWNNLADPSYIQVDQRIRLFAHGSTAEAGSPEPVALPPATIPAVKPAEPAVVAIPVLSEPKARRAAYSEQALAELTQHGNSMQKRGPATTTPTTTPVQVAAPTASAPAKPATPPKSVQVGFSGLPDERLTWQWPTNGTVTYGFGEGANYKGMGINGVMGQAVFASAPGKVVYSGSGLRGYGKLIIIKHNATYLSVYAHNSQLLVKEGQTVAQGQKIAEIGDSDSDQVGLHFEIRRLGKPIDPQKYLPEKAS